MEISSEIKKVTNTLKLTHNKNKNTNKILWLGVEEFYVPLAISLHIFIHGVNK
jgi:hypothetical protein